MSDYRQSEEYCEYFKKKGWVVRELESTHVLIKYIPYLGSIIKIQRGSADIPLKKIEKFAQKHNAALLVLEPEIRTNHPNYKNYENSLKNAGFKDVNMFMSPTKTSYINLEKSEVEILANFGHDIKKSLRLNTDRPIEYTQPENLEEFYSLLYETEHRQHIFIQKMSDWKKQWQPFGSQIKIIMAYLNGDLLGGNMFILNSDVAYGLFLPITVLGRNNRIAAPLIWEGLKTAKNHGCKIFDLNGLYDERYNLPKRWLGLSEFKKKFNGNEIEFMHPKIKIYAKILKPLDRLGLLWMFYVVA